MISITMLSARARAAAEAQKEAIRAEQNARAQIEDAARRSECRTSREFKPAADIFEGVK